MKKILTSKLIPALSISLVGDASPFLSPQGGGRLWRLLLLIMVGFLGLRVEAVEVAAVSEKPNIIFVLTDDMGYGDLGLLYQNMRKQQNDPAIPFFLTPHLDQIASEGVLLTDHYSGAPVCAPSRASLLTGMNQGNAVIRDNMFDNALENNHTLATVLKQSGYSTAAFGKWGLAGKDEKKSKKEKDSKKDKNPKGESEESGANDVVLSDLPAHPLKRGFDYYFGYLTHGAGHYHYPQEDNQKVTENYENLKEDLSLCYTTDLFTARCKKWIVDQKKSDPTKPFFVYLAYDTPHAKLQYPPCEYPKEGVQWKGQSGAMINTAQGKYDSYCYPEYKNAMWDHDQNKSTPVVPWPDVNRRYASGVHRIDDAMGDLFRTLQELKIDENTLIVFSSDNGPSLESYLKGNDSDGNTYNYTPDFFRSYAQFEGMKRDLYDGGCRVPTFVRWPAKIPAGKKDSMPSGFWDWMATFCEVAGTIAPARTDGVSLLPRFTGSGAVLPSSIYLEYEVKNKIAPMKDFSQEKVGKKRGQQQMLRIGDFVAVRYDIEKADDPFQIYNIVTDPAQRINLAGNPEVASLVKKFQEESLRYRVPSPLARRPYDSTAIAALTSPPEKKGVQWALYHGSWPWLPKMEFLPAFNSGLTDSLSLAKIPLKENQGSMLSGSLQVPESGEYEFFIQSNGMHLLKIHEALVVDQGGDSAQVTGSSVKIVLEKGIHPFRLYYALSPGKSEAPSLTVEWSSATMKRGPITKQNLY